ncbi:FecR family protein [Novosphingobium terrae]|uniref:FecR family protein n=1 Tax=Novosphingobium terrae TaxID=2726189 RepID=UPI00197FF0CF|nr:FecR domain-containing protein [Novosphingobium terrae]
MRRQDDDVNGAPDDPLSEQAALWLARHQLGTLDQDAFHAWRMADPRNALAFARALAAWDAAGRLPVPEAAPVTQSTPVSRRSFMRAAAAAGAVTVAGAGGFASRAYAWSTASTRLGESRKIRLPDGSSAALNTLSRLSWRFSSSERTLWIEQGEVAVDLVDGPPAALHGEDRLAHLSAGRFNARLRGDMLDLMVMRGQADTAGASAQSGHSLLISPHNAVARPFSTMQMATAMAWQQGEILFPDTTLGAAVEEYNRYLARKIVIVDPELAAIPVGGRFTSSDPAAFLRGISLGLGVHVATSDSGYFLTR